jgi:chromosome segregation ATPase
VNSLRYCLLGLAYALVLLFQGCSQPQGTGPAPDLLKAQDVVSELQSQLSEARKDLARQHAQNGELIERVQSVMDKLKEAEKDRDREREERKAAEARKAVQEEATRSASASGISDPVRIKLMGAKALAEFRAKQLTERLDKLSKDLEAKEQELKAIRENAKKKDEEVQALTKRFDELRATADAKTAELSGRIEKVTKELSQSSAEAKQLEDQLNEKTGLLDALKNAVGDAGRLKARAENEGARLKEELDETQKQLAAKTQESEQRGKQVEELRQGLTNADQHIEQLNAVTAKLRNRVEQLQAAQEQGGQEIEQLKAEWERSKQEAEQYRTEADRAREEVVQFRVEAERQKKMAEGLQAQTSELAAKLQEYEKASQAAQAPQEEGPSTVDRILQAPTAGGEPTAPPSNLY